MSNYIIEVKNLTKSYRDLKAVNNISFKVKKGTLFAFLGVNGAGKSTTINIMTSILNKDQGIIMINNFDLDLESDLVKKDIGIVFQHSVLDRELTVIQNLKSRASLYSLDKEQTTKRINYLITEFDLRSIVKKQYKNLSGGQRRRVDIARALIHEPEILFLDEPTTGLDPSTRINVWQILNKLIKEDNLTIFLTTHHMEEVVRANHIIIIDEGEIVASGSPDELKDMYASDILRIISNDVKDVKKITEVLTSNNISFNKINNSFEINVKSSSEAYSIISMNPKLFNNFEVLKGNMDQVFLNVTGKKIEGGFGIE